MNSADMDMFPDPSMTATSTLARAAQDFASQWPSLGAQIRASEDALGSGRAVGDLVSDAFREKYNRSVPSAMEGANGLAQMFGEGVTVSRGHIGNYVETDGVEVPALMESAKRAWT
jgi:hypothetical protein